MKVAVVGATGMVGQVMLEVLKERSINISEFIPVASPRSVGKSITFKGEDFILHSMEDAIAKSPDVAIFSAGSGPSLNYAPAFAEKGTFVVDNSSAWRMDESVPLVVPEINATAINRENKIIANPNCSTIQLVMVLQPLHLKYGLERVIISTYQSMTGTGVKAVKQYNSEENGKTADYEMVYPHPIYKNCIPHCDIFLDNAYTKEEMKMVHESRKIMGDASLKISATSVRVPVTGGHSESVNIEFKTNFDMDELVRLLEATPGVVVLNELKNNIYPTPRNAEGKDEVFVGRIRKDDTRENCLNMWIVSDNLRKGAATNAVQIVQYLDEKGFLNNR